MFFLTSLTNNLQNHLCCGAKIGAALAFSIFAILGSVFQLPGENGETLAIGEKTAEVS